MESIVIPTSKGDFKTLVSDIVRIQSSSNYSKIYFTNNSTLLVAKVLRWFNDTLSPTIFARVHKSHLINKSHIKDIQLDNYSIVMDNGQKVCISKRKMTVVKKTFFEA